ncbi:hypothetical protein [Brevundimonas sp.]|uniref:hypothetical protein n=1 Tax=Brevundimonas sp. TaxID=1871086 RepID=UPI003AF9F87F
MLAPLNSFLCRHDFYWSERHGAERCRRCAKLRQNDKPTHAEPLRFEAPPVRPDAEVMPFPDVVHSVEATAPAPAPSHDLRTRIEHLADGQTLDRAAVLALLLDLIEDGQSSDPQIVGVTAAEIYARLHAAAAQA